jgi:hypothetical protein
MDILFVIGPYKDSGEAEGGIFARFFDSETFKKENCYLSFFVSKMPQEQENNPQFLPIQNPFISWKHPFIRLSRKAMFICKKNPWRVSANYYFKSLNRLTKNTQIDAVVGAAGWFSSLETAYQLSLKRSIPLFLLYLDPFANNPIAPQGDIQTEKKWDERASAIFYDCENLKPLMLSKKEKYQPVYLPLLEDFCKTDALTNTIIYGGNFYRGIRNPETILRIAENPLLSSYVFEIYTNSKIDTHGLQNVHVYPSCEHGSFIKKCREAKGIILIGNGTNSSYVPSKLYETISLNRIIISINSPCDCGPLQSYPLTHKFEDSQTFYSSLKQALDDFSIEQANTNFLPASLLPRSKETASKVFYSLIADFMNQKEGK